MARSLISGVLKPLGSFSSELAKQEWKQARDVEKDVLSITSKLKAIQFLLEDAEKKKQENPCVGRWLDQLKDVSYDIYNVLDEWSTEILISQIQKQEEADNDALVLKILSKVCFSLPPSCFCLTQLEQVGIRREIAVKIKQLNDKLDGIAKERRDYSLETIKAVPYNNKRRESTSFVDVYEVYGRDVDKSHLFSKLLCDSRGRGGEGPVIIPIVGMGGIGKNTLAKLAFNDDEVKANFNQLVWVCVSDPFDEIGVAKAILQELKASLPNLQTLQASFQRIRESIEGKKFLLGLDDVWTDDGGEMCEDFVQPFRSAAAGSRLLITTRKHQVATMMGYPPK